jgi:uncharacterized protein (TIGR00255 family)
VFQSDDELVEAETVWPVVEEAVKQALAALVKMREREGHHLAGDLSARIGVMRAAVEKVQTQAPQTAENYRRQLHERIKCAGLEAIAPDDERLLKEIVLFADRSDISEELTRLQSHFQQFEDCAKAREPVGRTLDFLAQEMNREINTIGSKANDAVISREVVILKAELEKFREQAKSAKRGKSKSGNYHVEQAKFEKRKAGRRSSGNGKAPGPGTQRGRREAATCGGRIAAGATKPGNCQKRNPEP